MLPTIGFMLLLTCTIIFSGFPATTANDDGFKTYVVHLASPQGQEFSDPNKLEVWYNSFLSEVVSSGSNQMPKMVHMYHHVITGFSATMSADQAKVMENLNGVVSVRYEEPYQLHTTRSPHFLGLSQNSGFWKHSNYGEGIIIGLVDSGITPGHPSFDDKGMPAPPARWKGKCEVAGCNNKLIGMRSFANGTSPIDEHGHGTHTASIAAGNYVDGANVFGQANGTASGIAPLAHVAMYRVCGHVIHKNVRCEISDTLAGMDAAIEEGVDVISISLGLHDYSKPFHHDSIAVGAFSAIKKGVFVSCGAGNGGPENTSVANEAPWYLTVGASTIDRRIRTMVKLGNNKLYTGESLYQPKDFDTDKLRSIVYPLKSGNKVFVCGEGSLDHIDVKGKVVLCDAGFEDNVEMGRVVKDAGGAAMIIANSFRAGESILADAHVIPTSYVGYNEGVEIKKYINSTYSPLSTILFSETVTNFQSDPEVASFSSRGPCHKCPGIIKPDIIGPGVDILAAWHKSADNMTTTKATFNIDHGTSMSCPHLAGTAALLKRAHPEWSPAAIKSAIMTTASQVSQKGPIVNEHGHPANIFAIGSGHVAPTKASDPGLVFDIQPDDYIPYLCGLGYTPKEVGMIVKKTVNCSKTIPEAELNYPSIAISLQIGNLKIYSRTATNVGPANSTYHINETSIPAGVDLQLEVPGSPSQELSFTEAHQKLEFRLIFSRDNKDKKRHPYDQGHITLVSGKHTVRMPISIKFE